MTRVHVKRLCARARLIVGSCLLWMGCQPTPSPRDILPTPTHVGDHLRFYTDEDGEGAMCGGSLAYMDRYVHELIRIHDASPDLVVDYYWFPTNHDRIAELCSNGTACTYADAVTVTPLIPHEHELVHAVRGEFGFSQGFLEEGAAEVWGAHNDRAFDYGLDVETGIELAQDDLPIEYYGTAGRFSAFVLSEFGLDAFVELGKMAAFESSAVEVDEAFESVIGMTASDVAESYRDASWRCGRSLYRDDSVSCAAARPLDCSLAGDDGTLTMALDLDCASERFVGPRDGVIWSDFVVPLTSARVVSVTLSANEAELDDLGLGELGLISVRPCGVGCEDQDGVWPMVPSFEYRLDLPAGQHLFRIEIPVDVQPRGAATLTIRNVCEPRG